MALHEFKKCAKIVEEITEYLLEKGYQRFDSSLEVMENETKIEMTVYTNGILLSEFLQKDLFCCRDVELEEYGWELTSDYDCVCSLDSLGLLVDRYDITETDETCILTLHRIND